MPDAAANGNSPSLISRLGASWYAAFSFVFVARGLASIATFLTIAVLGRTLGRAHYGDLVILLTVMKVASELAGPALDTALVRFFGASATRGVDPTVFMRAVLRAKLWLAAGIVIGGALLAWPIQQGMFLRGQSASVPLYALGLAFVASALSLLYAYVQSCFQAKQQFGAYAWIEISGAVLRLAAVSAIAIAGHGTVTNLFVAYAAAPLVVAAVALAVAPAIRAARGPVPRDAWAALWHFTKWVVAACAFTSLAQRVDVFLVAALHVPAPSVSDYCAAVQLALLGDLVILSLFNVLLPQASRLHEKKELMFFLRGFRFPTAVCFAGLIPLLAGSGPIAAFTFGDTYVDTGALFAVLLAGTAFALGSAPAGAALYGLGRSRTIALLEFIKFSGILVGGVAVVPEFGVLGMAWTVAAVKGGTGILTYALALWHVNRARPASSII